MRVLEQKGLIEIRLGVGGGSVVKSVEADCVSESLGLLIRSQKVSLNHLAEFREIVEGSVAAQAAERRTPADVAHLNALLREAEACVGPDGGRRGEFLEADKRIHLAIAATTRNPLHVSLLTSIHDNIHRYYDRFLSMDGSELEQNYRDLSALVDAVARGSAEAARRLAQEHVERFNRFMQQRESLRPNDPDGGRAQRPWPQETHMTPGRIHAHPVLTVPDRLPVSFTWNDAPFTGFENEMISSALVASGVQVFGHHPKDRSPQGLFCANGQCSQCLVIADGRPVKACMTPLRAGMRITPVEGLPRLPAVDAPAVTAAIETAAPEVLVIGGGPAGLSAAVELGPAGRPHPGRRRQGPAGREARAADAQVLRLGGGFARRDARL